jgi:hypothetical protein
MINYMCRNGFTPMAAEHTMTPSAQQAMRIARRMAGAGAGTAYIFGNQEGCIVAAAPRCGDDGSFINAWIEAVE